VIGQGLVHKKRAEICRTVTRRPAYFKTLRRRLGLIMVAGGERDGGLVPRIEFP